MILLNNGGPYMKRILKLLFAGILICTLFNNNHIQAEETYNELTIEDHKGDCKHHYTPSPVGNRYIVYVNGVYHWYQTYINICDYCGDYYYSTVDLGIV